MFTSRKGRRWLLTCVTIWLAISTSVRSRACNKKMNSKNLREGEEIRETRVVLNCESGNIKWQNAKKSHVLTFFKGQEDLVVCLTINRPGARVYRLKGSQRQPIAGVNDTGFVGCYKSECKHVSFLFQVDDNYRGPKNLNYAYSGYLDIKCPECTETCQRDCLCSSEFVFYGKLRRSVYRTNTYLYYFQVAHFMKYNGLYRDPHLAREIENCPAEETHSNVTEKESDEDPSLEDRIIAEVPPTGMVRAIAKCPLRLNKTYFVSATLHITRNGRPRLIMCCQHSDERFAVTYLVEMVHRQECCRHI